MPQVLYKYRSAIEGLKILITSKIWFSSPDGFEDKNDCRPPFTLTNPTITKDNAIDTINQVLNSTDPIDIRAVNSYGREFLTNKVKKGIEAGKKPRELLENIFKKHLQKDIRILSLSTTHNTPKMWSEYADNSKGMVIGIKKLTNIDNPTPVKYCPPKNCKVNGNGTFHDYFVLTKKGNDDIYLIFTTKSKKYEYEQEYRYILFVEKEKQKLKNNTDKKYVELYINLNNSKGVLFPLEKEDIVEIYLGENMNIFTKLLIHYIVKVKYPNTKILRQGKEE